ncbi:8805_t:CDS:2 [Paraglomus brasilianum]|uniref:8805_t:CDS:1 n=1 Tax=Paraglomus brasilianum TaxID=144538 RepID=A0A9N8ZI20_9GLOM|nr:8805_t:CDS:2 [Paraglomus brasilianum]
MASLLLNAVRLSRTQGIRSSQIRFASTTAAVAEKSGQVAKSVQNLVTKTTALRKPILYNAAVVKELVKEVWKREDLSPPSLAQIEEARTYLQKTIRWKYIKSLSLYDYARIGIRSVEVAGFFFIGEVIGRRSLIGYNV